MRFYVYVHNGILFSLKKEENLAVCYKMNEPEGIMLNEINQTKTNSE